MAVVSRRLWPGGRAAPARFDALSLAVLGVGLALPYVRVEPAGVDLLMLSLLPLAAVRGLRVPRALLAGALAYAIGNAVALAAGFTVARLQPGFALRYVAIETLLLLSVLGAGAVFHSRPALLRGFLRAYVVGAVAAALLIWALRLGLPDAAPIWRDQWHTRLQGFFRDPNVLGPFLLFPIAALIHAREALGLPGRWRWALLPLGLLVAATLSRAALIGLVLVLASGLPRLLRRRYRAGPAALMAIVLASVVVGMTVIPHSSPVGASGEGAAAGRLALALQAYDNRRFADLEAALQIGLARPLGLGPGGFGQLLATNNAHNLFLGKLTDAGVVPALLVTALPLAGMWTAWRHRRRTAGLGTALAVTLGAHLVISSVIYSHHWRHMLLLSVAAVALRGGPDDPPAGRPRSEGACRDGQPPGPGRRDGDDPRGRGPPRGARPAFDETASGAARW